MNRMTRRTNNAIPLACIAAIAALGAVSVVACAGPTTAPAKPATAATAATAAAAAPTPDPATMKILRDLEAAGDKYHTIKADVDYKVINRVLGDSEERTGWVAYSKGDANTPSKFRVSFETLQLRGGPKTAEKVDYVFDGLWLTVVKHKIKNITMYQLAAKGQKVEALKIGKGPFPVPFGQSANDMVKYFETSTREPVESDPKGTIYLRLITRKKYADEMPTTRMEMWIDAKTHLPVKLKSYDKNKNLTTATFKDIQTNQAVKEDVFRVPRPAGYETIRRPLGQGGAPRRDRRQPLASDRPGRYQGAMNAPQHLRINDLVSPLGLDDTSAVMGWQLTADRERDQRQSAWRILVAKDPDLLSHDTADVWDSGKREARATRAAYEGPKLQSARTYWWKVRAWDQADQPTPWSAPARFGTGLLSADDWQAQWIGRGPATEPHLPHEHFNSDFEKFLDDVEVDERSTLLRKEFSSARPVRSARLFVTGLGFYELYINGRRIGDAVNNPARTEYRHRVLYDAFDVTDAIRHGANALAIMLGNGWFNPAKKFWGWRMQWYGSPRAILQCHVEYDDGTNEIIRTDATWRAAPGPVTANCVYDGEVYDARLEQPGWDAPGFDDAAWQPANVVEAPGGFMQYHAIEPIRITESFGPAAVNDVQPGVFVFDMGQNYAGLERLRVTGPAGTAVQMRFAENVHPDGTLDTKTNTFAGQADTYVLKGDGLEIWQPRFTYHGFRYVEVTGYPGKPGLDAIEALVMRSDCRQTGEFECDNEVVSRVHRCTIWSEKSNMMGLPTDDCQRSERMGWTGDALVTFDQYVCNFDMAAFYRKWLWDLSDSQFANGDIPIIAPRACEESESFCWASAWAQIPWYCYRTYGDIRFLRDHFDGMKRFVEFLRKTSDGLILPADRYSDHCSVRPGWEHGKPLLTSTWYFYYDTLTLARAAKALGKTDGHRRYTELAARIRDAFNERFLDTATGRYDDGSQCSQVMALTLDMVPAECRQAAIDHLVSDIRDRCEGCLDTGILGTRHILECLEQVGHADLAWQLASQEKAPSWGSMTAGRTTLSESWSAQRGTNNHVMFGAVDAWYYQTLGGIRLDLSKPEPESLVIAPYFDAPLNEWHAVREIPAGRVVSAGRKTAGQIEWNVEVPANAVATLRLSLAGKAPAGVREGGRSVKDGNIPGIRSVAASEDKLEVVARFRTICVRRGSAVAGLDCERRNRAAMSAAEGRRYRPARPRPNLGDGCLENVYKPPARK